MKKGTSGKAVYRKDYTPYPWVLDKAVFRFEIDEESTRIRSKLHIRRNHAAQAATDIELDGQNMQLVSVFLDGTALEASESGPESGQDRKSVV